MSKEMDIRSINEHIQQESELVDRILKEMDRVIVGQRITCQLFENFSGAKCCANHR